MTECIALLRGINVGRAKRIAMADLRGLLVDLGDKEVRTRARHRLAGVRLAQNYQGTLDAAYRRRVLSPPRTTRP
jgi:Protein of unknown function (DUF1697)